MAVKIGELRLTVKAPYDQSREAVLHNVLHYLSLFTNLVLASCLQKKKWYLHGDIETINRISYNLPLGPAAIQNGLHDLFILYTTLFNAVAQKDIFLKTWHW